MENVKVWGLWDNGNGQWLMRAYEPEFSLAEDDPKLTVAADACDCIVVKEIPLEIAAKYQWVSRAVKRFLLLRQMDLELTEAERGGA